MGISYLDLCKHEKYSISERLCVYLFVQGCAVATVKPLDIDVSRNMLKYPAVYDTSIHSRQPRVGK